MITFKDPRRHSNFLKHGESIVINQYRMKQWEQSAAQGNTDLLSKTRFWEILVDPKEFKDYVDLYLGPIEDDFQITPMDLVLDQPHVILLHEVRQDKKKTL